MTTDQMMAIVEVYLSKRKELGEDKALSATAEQFGVSAADVAEALSYANIED